MAKIYDGEQLNKFDKETIIQLFLMQQEQLAEIDKKYSLYSNSWQYLESPDEIYHRYSFIPAKIALEEHHVAVYSGKKTEHMEKGKTSSLSPQRQSCVSVT